MISLVLINPPVSLFQRYGAFAKAGSVMPPLGLCSLAAVCRANGFKVFVIDAVAECLSLEVLITRICQINPTIVGLTAMTCGIDNAASVALHLKKELPGIVTLLGGPHVTALPKETMLTYSQFDIGFIGESERAIVEYLKAVSIKSPLNCIQGIVFRENGEILFNPPGEFIADLDSIPFPAWDMLNGFPNIYYPALIRSRKMPACHMVTSRGCPMKCTFCDRSVFGYRYRFYSVTYIFNAIKTLHDNFGIKDILFEDDSFTFNKNRIVELCNLIIQSNLCISWSCLGRVDCIDQELLQLMKKAGCWQIGFGIESGSQAMLASVEKKTNLSRITETLILTKKNGINTKGFFILGLPHETCASIQETISFALALALDDISVSFCTIFPGTALAETAGSYGEIESIYGKMNLMKVTYTPHGLSKKELEHYRLAFIKKFYLRPRIFMDYVMRGFMNFRFFIRLCQSFSAIFINRSNHD